MARIFLSLLVVVSQVVFSSCIVLVREDPKDLARHLVESRSTSNLVYVREPVATDLSKAFSQINMTKIKDSNDPDYSWIISLKDYPGCFIAGYPRKIRTDMVTKMINKHHQWDPNMVNSICDLVKKHPKGNFLDVGGNIGAYTIPIASCLKQAGGDRHVVTVELSPDNGKKLITGLLASNLTNVNLYQYGVMDAVEQDVVGVASNGHNAGMTHVSLETTSENPQQHVTTLDAIMKSERKERILAMKIDIEGYEANAFRGFKEFLSVSPPCVLVAELVHSGEDLLNLIKEAGFVHKYTEADGMTDWFEQEDLEGCLAKL